MFSPSIADPHEKIGTPTHRSRRRNELRRRQTEVVELLDGERRDPQLVTWRRRQLAAIEAELEQLDRRQLTEVVHDLVGLEVEAAVMSAEIARRRQTGGAR